jgi:kynurenine formamidase
VRIVNLSHGIRGRIQTQEFRNHSSKFTSVEESAYVNRKSRTVDELPIEYSLRSAVLLDVTYNDSGTSIDDEVLESAEEYTGVAIREVEIVILQTGWEEYFLDKRYEMVFPTLSKNAVDYLLFRRIAGIGVDNPSIDPRGTLKAHRKLLQKNVTVMENLCNINEVVMNRFHIILLALKVHAARAPVRVVAILDDFQ